MQTYVQYHVCEGPLPALSTLRHTSMENAPTCFLLPNGHLHGLPRVDADDLLSFLETYGDTPDKFQVLLFWSKHPRARCTVDCMYCTPASRRLDLRKAVQDLVRQGLITELRGEEPSWYALTTDPEMRRSVENMGVIHWDQLRFWNDFRVVELVETQVSS